MDELASKTLDCPLAHKGIVAVDRIRQIGTAADAAYTEGANLAAMTECWAECSTRGLCLADNPDRSGGSDRISQILNIFELAEGIGSHREYALEMERDVPPHPRYKFRF